MHICALSLGSNVQPEWHVSQAMHALRAYFPGARMSSAYRFAAVGFAGPAFVNAAAVVASELDVYALNAWLRALEARYGRERGSARYGNRTLDIDIVLFDDAVIDGNGGLHIPRAELRHAFVLKPLAEIAPELLHPQLGRSIGVLWAGHPQHEDAFEPVQLPPVDAPLPSPNRDADHAG